METTVKTPDHTINGCAPINAQEMATYSAEQALKPKDNGFKGRIQPGQVLNPNGRPKGTRNKLCEQFLLDMQTVWTEVTEVNGKPSVMALDVIRAVATNQPSKMLSAMGQVLPKDFQVSVDIDQVTWVINAIPLSTEQWQAEHGLETDEDT